MKFTAKVWKVGDDINTDLILPNKAFYLTPEEQKEFVFHANRHGWAREVKKGDILVGGKNFGMGSSYPAARSLKNLGLACLLAPYINGLFSATASTSLFPRSMAPACRRHLRRATSRKSNSKPAACATSLAARNSPRVRCRRNCSRWSWPAASTRCWREKVPLRRGLNRGDRHECENACTVSVR